MITRTKYSSKDKNAESLNGDNQLLCNQNENILSRTSLFLVMCMKICMSLKKTKNKI